MTSHPRLYLTVAFLTGVFLTLGFKDFYPDLERRFRRRKRLASDDIDEQPMKGKITLEDDKSHRNIAASEGLDQGRGREGIVDGIEGTIGNTPLIRIKSLSEATGCEVLAKVEVFL